MRDETLIGTQRLTARIEAYNHETGETTVVEIEQWQERDGSLVSDPARIDQIRAAQARQAREQNDGE